MSATLVGLSLGTNVAGQDWLIVSLAAALLCFAGAATFQRSSWSLLFLAGLAFAAGVVLGLLVAESLSQLWIPVGTGVFLLVAAGAAGRAWPRRLLPLYRPLWWLVMLLLIVGVLLSLTQAAGGLGERPSWLTGWSLAWGILFVALAAAWFAGLEREPSPGAPLHLYLLWLNLFLSNSLLAHPG